MASSMSQCCTLIHCCRGPGRYSFLGNHRHAREAEHSFELRSHGSIEHPPPKLMPRKALKATGQGQVGHLASHWEGSRTGLSGHSSGIPAVILGIRANDCLHRPLMTRAWQSVQLQCSRYSAHLRSLSSPSCPSRPCKSNDSLAVRRRKVNRQLQLMSAATSDSAATETRAVPLSELRELVHDSLLGMTYPKREAEIIGDVSIVLTVA